MCYTVIPYVRNMFAESSWGTPHEGVNASYWGVNNNKSCEVNVCYIMLNVVEYLLMMLNVLVAFRADVVE